MIRNDQQSFVNAKRSTCQAHGQEIANLALGSDLGEFLSRLAGVNIRIKPGQLLFSETTKARSLVCLWLCIS